MEHCTRRNIQLMKFTIRDSKGKKEGPNKNVFSENNVKLSSGLELSIGEDGSCAEIFTDSLEYGTYEFELESPVFLPKDIICGVFLYQDDKHEYDLELGRWGKTISRNAQFVSQGSGQKQRFWNFCSVNKIKIIYREDVIQINCNGNWQIWANDLKNACLCINLWDCRKKKETPASICSVKVRWLNG